MSSFATLRGRAAAHGSSRAAHPARALPLRLSTDAALGLALAAGLALVAFSTAGGAELEPNTWTEIALTLLGVVLAIAVLVLAAPGRAWGAITLSLFAALAAFTAVSISWSVQPEHSWLEANRTLSCLAVFGGAVALSRLLPERWPALVGAIALAATLVSAYALLVKVFPATLDRTDVLGRVRAPFDYWNATGLMAALGLPACMWAGARRERGRALRALCVPAVAILVTVLLLSYSRSALLAAVVGLGCWFALAPLRLRAALVLGLGVAGGAALTLWALATHPLTHDRASLAARTTAGRSFGLILLLVLALAAISGFGAAFAMDRIALPSEVRRRAGVVLVSLVGLIPLGGLVALAVSPRGLTGEVSHVWNTLTSTQERVGDTSRRLVELGNSRPRYWSEGLKVGDHALINGVGAVGYGTARTRYTNDPWIVGHAHSYVIETFADFGLIGIALNLALLVAWGVAAARALGAQIRVRWPALRRSGPPSTAAMDDSPGQAVERAGLLTLLCVVIVFGVHSTVDWTWFIPGTVLPALACAGWLAGRGRPAEPVGRAAKRRRLSRSPAAAAAVAGLVVLTVLGTWAIWQPLRAVNADSAAITALSRGDTKAALADARAAAARDPLAVEPLWELAAIDNAIGEGNAAHAELARAVTLQPANPATWRQLGLYELQHHQPRSALGVLERSLALDLSSTATVQAIRQARAELQQAPGIASRGLPQ